MGGTTNPTGSGSIGIRAPTNPYMLGPVTGQSIYAGMGPQRQMPQQLFPYGSTIPGAVSGAQSGINPFDPGRLNALLTQWTPGIFGKAPSPWQFDTRGAFAQNYGGRTIPGGLNSLMGMLPYFYGAGMQAQNPFMQGGAYASPTQAPAAQPGGSVPGYTPSFAQPAPAPAQSAQSSGPDYNDLYQQFRTDNPDSGSLGFAGWYQSRTGNRLPPEAWSQINF